MTFVVGDRVVYPHHGAAIIVDIVTIEAFGETQDFLVLQMTHGELTLKVPAARAEEVGVRYPISIEEVDEVFDVIARRDIREPSNWSRRFKNHQEKLKSGDVYQVAEVVRNLALRRADKGLSAGEKTMYASAEQVLVSELAFALKLPEDRTLERLEQALT